MEEIISYPVFKGLQKPLEFMGIRGKFIYYAAGTFLFGFIGFLVFNILLGFLQVLLHWLLSLVLALFQSSSSRNSVYIQSSVIRASFTIQVCLIIDYEQEERTTIRQTIRRT